MKKLKKGKMKSSSMGMEAYKPKPVSIHLHAEGEHLDAAHKDLARQLKPMGFTMRKSGQVKPKSKKSISDALAS